jgi:hypothetical protein
MKKLLLLSVLWCVATVRAINEKPEATEPPLAPLASLIGGLWVGDLPPDGKMPMKIELRFAWAENKQAVRFDSAFVQGDKRSPYTSGMYVWSPAKGKIGIIYTDFSGSLTEGTITPEGGVLVNDLLVSHPDGKIDAVRVRLTKVGPDEFTNEIFVQKDGAWAPFVTVRYVRGK